VNRFTLQALSQAEVDETYREFAAKGESIGITQLGALETANGKVNFIFSDVDKNWWELTTRL
jgi:hypothetical protein